MSPLGVSTWPSLVQPLAATQGHGTMSRQVRHGVGGSSHQQRQDLSVFRQWHVSTEPENGWFIMVYYNLLWFIIMVCYYGLLWFFMVYYGFLMVYYGVLWFMVYYGALWFIIMVYCYYGLLW